MHELDTLVSRTCTSDLRGEYMHMLHAGYEHFVAYGASPRGVQGLKFVVLAKAVTTGKLTGEARRTRTEVRGRVRLVNDGYLEQLVEEMFEDAEALAKRRRVEAEAQALRRLLVEDSAGGASAAVSEARVVGDAVEALLAATAPGRDRLGAADGGGVSPAGAPPVASPAGGSSEAVSYMDGGAPAGTSLADDHLCGQLPLVAGDTVRLSGISCREDGPSGLLEWLTGGRTTVIDPSEVDGELATVDHWVAERGRWAVRTPRVVGLLLVHDRRLVLVKEASRKRAAAATPASTAAEKEAEALDVEKRLTVVLRLCAAGYLSKGYSQFGTSPLKDPGETQVRATLRGLHPQPGDRVGVGVGGGGGAGVGGGGGGDDEGVIVTPRQRNS